MKVKAVVSFVLTLLFILACSTAAFPAPDPTVISTPQPTETAIPTQSLNLTTITFSEEEQTPVYKITAEYPAIVESADPRAAAFNSLIQNLVMGEVNQFRSDTLQNTSNPPLTSGSFFDVRYSVTGQAGNFWSIKFDITGYSDGAAHPYHYSIPVNYNLEQGREIALDEIFLPNSNYLQIVSEYCKAELSTRDIGFDMSVQGADPLPENYRRWNVSHDGLVITFDEYQVAPYAAGSQVVAIAFSELERVINRQGPVAPFLP